jgi:hypothetical protein
MSDMWRDLVGDDDGFKQRGIINDNNRIIMIQIGVKFKRSFTFFGRGS